MRFQFISLGLLTLQIGASVLPVDSNHRDLAENAQPSNISMAKNASLGAEPPIALEADMFEKRGKKSKPKPKPKSTKSKAPTKSKTPTKSKAPMTNKTTTKIKTTPTSSPTPTSKSTPLGPHKAVSPLPEKYIGGECKLKKPAAKDITTTKTKATRSDMGLEKRADKILSAGSLRLVFPVYPRAGDVMGAARYRNLVIAYGARDPNACNNDYAFGAKPFPRFNVPHGDGLETNDQWNTEHVLDAQVVAAFFNYLMSSSSIKAKIPRGVRTANGRVRDPSTEEWLKEFWNDRKVSGVDAMTELLSVYPGTHSRTNELTLLGAKINGKKQSVFSLHDKSCIGSSKKNKSFFERIDDLNYCVHLSKYVSNPTVSSHMVAVVDRITAKLRQMEGSNGFLMHTDDYHGKKSDRQGEMYESLGLARKWDTWVESFIKARVAKLDSTLSSKLKDLKDEVAVAKRVLEDSLVVLRKTESTTQKAADHYNRSRSKQDYDALIKWQGYFRRDKATYNQNVANYNAMKASNEAIQQGTSRTKSPL